MVRVLRVRVHGFQIQRKLFIFISNFVDFVFILQFFFPNFKALRLIAFVFHNLWDGLMLPGLLLHFSLFGYGYCFRQRADDAENVRFDRKTPRINHFYFDNDPSSARTGPISWCDGPALATHPGQGIFSSILLLIFKKCKWTQQMERKTKKITTGPMTYYIRRERRGARATAFKLCFVFGLHLIFKIFVFVDDGGTASFVVMPTIMFCSFPSFSLFHYLCSLAARRHSIFILRIFATPKKKSKFVRFWCD